MEPRTAPPSSAVEPHEHHLTVSKTARYVLLGELTDEVTEVWFVCHGFGQLARSFVREFLPVARPSRVIVAPEALSRFYLGEVTGATSATARIGATWMTREDRLSEIADYVGYLDALYRRIFESIRREQTRVTALGFSQGVATVSRWAALGAARIDRLVLWGGRLPDEFIAPEHVIPMRRMRLVAVVGQDDPHVTLGAQRVERARFDSLGLSGIEWLTFDGGHTLDPRILETLTK